MFDCNAWSVESGFGRHHLLPDGTVGGVGVGVGVLPAGYEEMLNKLIRINLIGHNLCLKADGILLFN